MVRTHSDQIRLFLRESGQSSTATGKYSTTKIGFEPRRKLFLGGRPSTWRLGSTAGATLALNFNGRQLLVNHNFNEFGSYTARKIIDHMKRRHQTRLFGQISSNVVAPVDCHQGAAVIQGAIMILGFQMMGNFTIVG